MNKSNDHPTCQCDCCHQDIPLSTALTPEGMDYVYHYCGEDCFEKWKKMKREEEKKK